MDQTPIHQMRLDAHSVAEYEVLRFEFENELCWAFSERRLAIVQRGVRYPFHDEPEKIMTYPKKRKCGEKKERIDGESVRVDLYEPTVPPRFLAELKLQAYYDERISLKSWEVDQLKRDRDTAEIWKAPGELPF